MTPSHTPCLEKAYPNGLWPFVVETVWKRVWLGKAACKVNCMSIELVAIMPGSDLPDRRRWQSALITLGLPWQFEISPDPSVTKGFCPMRAGKVVSGVEILDDTLDALPGHVPINAPHRVVVFRWGGDMLECACAFSAIAGLAEACGAAIHDPSKDPTLIDLPHLRAMAAKVTEEALAQNSQAPSVEKVVRAITKMPEIGSRFVVDRRVVCRAVDGPYLRGLHIDRTSSPGVYRLRAMQTLWCMIEKTVYLNHSIELRGWLRGGLDRILDGFRHELKVDDGVRRCIMADPGEPFLFDPRFYTGEENTTPHPWVERAIMRALDGDGAGALPLLRRAIERFPDQTKRTSNHKWAIIPEVISCIEQGNDVGALLYPLTQEAKARVSIKPVRLSKPSVS